MKTPTVEESIVEFFKRGESITALTWIFDCSRSTVCRTLDNYGIIRPTCRKPKVFTKAEKRGVCRSYRTGTNMTILAEEYNCCRQAIARLLREEGVYTPRRYIAPRAYTIMQEERAVRLYQEGLTLCETAEAIGASFNAVRGWLIERDIPRRKRHITVTSVQKLQMVRAYNGGHSLIKIARRFKIPVSAVHACLKKQNVQLRSRGRPKTK